MGLSPIANKAGTTMGTVRNIIDSGSMTQPRAMSRSIKPPTRTRDGTEFDAELSIALLRDESGDPVGFIAVTRDITERKRLRENMQFYISEITRAQEERRRIARELHAETVQSLVSLSLDIESICKDKDELSEETTRRLEQLRDKTHSIMQAGRCFSHELRPDVLEKLGLMPALELLTDELNTGGKTKAQLEVTGDERRVSAEAELVLFRIAQEAVRNIWRHSQTTEAIVRVKFTPEKVKLSVTDNGMGFELPEVLSDLASEGKLGLIGMQERARLLDGSFLVESQMGKGTTVAVEVVM